MQSTAMRIPSKILGVPPLRDNKGSNFSTPRPSSAASAQKSKERSWKLLRTALFGENLSDRFDVDHLAAFIKTARRANAMRHVRRRALRARAQLRQRHHTVICAP